MHVLIVDDQPYARITTKLLLRQIPGIRQISEAVDGRDALEFLQHHRPDIILMDIRMPGIDGIEATRRIKRNNPHIEIIALSYTDFFAEEAVAAGADKFVLKTGDSLPLIKEIIRSGGHKIQATDEYI